MAVGCILLAASGPASACVGTIVTCMHGEQPGYTRHLPKTPLQLPRSVPEDEGDAGGRLQEQVPGQRCETHHAAGCCQASSGIWRNGVACQCPPAGCFGVCATPDPEQHDWLPQHH